MVISIYMKVDKKQLCIYFEFSETLGIYVFDRYYHALKTTHPTPFYVKDTNDFVLSYHAHDWCIGRDLSHLNDEVCVNYGY